MFGNLFSDPTTYLSLLLSFGIYVDLKQRKRVKQSIEKAHRFFTIVAGEEIRTMDFHEMHEIDPDDFSNVPASETVIGDGSPREMSVTVSVLADDIAKGYDCLLVKESGDHGLPLHRHVRSSELLVCVKGSLICEIDGVAHELNEDEYVYIEKGKPHRVSRVSEGCTYLIVARLPIFGHGGILWRWAKRFKKKVL